MKVTVELEVIEVPDDPDVDILVIDDDPVCFRGHAFLQEFIEVLKRRNASDIRASEFLGLKELYNRYKRTISAASGKS